MGPGGFPPQGLPPEIPGQGFPLEELDLEPSNWVEADPEFRTDVEIIPQVPNVDDTEIGGENQALDPNAPGQPGEELGAIDDITGMPQDVVDAVLTCTKYY